ncbi:Cyclin, N-terminal domain [Carpediemonas membranifera]|uniref:Cyclin, N-terminal domain n=1 Tax=Carpediemonas membranifera TaxID=201153 RepID=A0A8J6E4T1_9EUKA|nr:Cyclin, N-terminal domain [Carpediemonas membranifera]|eukprot:KAG9397583.1 Cyclin, N-terminal domain [Carpediemonas membranifera]
MAAPFALDSLTSHLTTAFNVRCISSESLSEMVGASALQNWSFSLMSHMRKEASSPVSNNYLKNVQKSYITPDMRQEAVSFIIDICTYDAYPPIVCERAIRLFDHCLAHSQVRRQAIQLLTLASISVSAKLEDDEIPSLANLVRYTDNLYSVEELMEAEHFVLRAVDWNAYVPTAHRALSFILGLVASTGIPETSIQKLWSLCSKFVFDTLPDYTMAQVSPCAMAVGMLNAAMFISPSDCSNKCLERLSRAGVDMDAADSVTRRLMMHHYQGVARSAITTPVEAKRALMEDL